MMKGNMALGKWRHVACEPKRLRATVRRKCSPESQPVLLLYIYEDLWDSDASHRRRIWGKHKTCTHSQCDMRRYKTKTHISSFHYTIKSTHLRVQRLHTHRTQLYISNIVYGRLLPLLSGSRVVLWPNGCGRTHMCALARCLIGFGHNLHRRHAKCVRVWVCDSWNCILTVVSAKGEHNSTHSSAPKWQMKMEYYIATMTTTVVVRIRSERLAKLQATKEKKKFNLIFAISSLFASLVAGRVFGWFTVN